MFSRKDFKIVFNFCLGSVKDVFMVVCWWMKNLSFRGLLILGYFLSIMIFIFGFKVKENESNCYII